jgi:hypothetical protein
MARASNISGSSGVVGGGVVGWLQAPKKAKHVQSTKANNIENIFFAIQPPFY